jgi:hypothetical protein
MTCWILYTRSLVREPRSASGAPTLFKNQEKAAIEATLRTRMLGRKRIGSFPSRKLVSASRARVWCAQGIAGLLPNKLMPAMSNIPNGWPLGFLFSVREQSSFRSANRRYGTGPSSQILQKTARPFPADPRSLSAMILARHSSIGDLRQFMASPTSVIPITFALALDLLFLHGKKC